MPSRSSRPVLELRRLCVDRGSTAILRDVSWRVLPGEHWVILGPNGCGKTSLLKTLTAYLTPSAGEIFVFDKKYGETDWRELRKHIGIVTSALQSMIPPAEVALDTVISGKYAMLDLWGSVTRADRRNAQEILRAVNGTELADRPWQFLSQGERQRVLVGRALMAKPKLLILDEACGGLDPVAREHFLSFIDRLARHPASPSMVFVTHHVEEIMSSFTHALLLRSGSVFAAGPKKIVLTSKNLRQIFGAPMRLKTAKGRYLLEVAVRGKKTF